MDLQSALKDFAAKQKFLGKGPLCVALIVTKHAQQKGLPLESDQLVTEGGGQVLGLGKSAVQAILARHGITKVLASEGGRTSRGSMGNMQQYVAFLNTLASAGAVDLVAVEKYWIDRVNDFFAAKPFKFRLDSSKSLRTVVRDVLLQAEERQKSTAGMQYVGAVMQHLVGAKLDCALGRGTFEHNSFSTSDAQTGRAGDFFIGDVAIHITTSPSEALIHRFQDNLDKGHRPVLVTRQKGLTVADVLAENAGIADRVDIFEVEQFIALNLYELAKFAAAGRKVAVNEVIDRYNEIVDEFETDPSLKIELK
ncbi:MULTISPECIES: DUF4928 family protein [unclassified Caballeronia]|jgi:hypothetical protein|uniref:DUF4928 family protein n=1 Tax=unclassified Caballeronia TaxID=2646786 RepID=UPI00202957D8|nr:MULTISPECIES: DUF4928 family protein [unclassified Caballeronia]